MNLMHTALVAAARLDRLGLALARIGLVLVLVWIGALKAFSYEDEGIVPFVANSPLMRFFYHYPAPDYRSHAITPGQVSPVNEQWHTVNGTYTVGHVMGAVIVAFGVLIAMHPWFPGMAALGSLMTALMSLVTLSFLITTPECWVPALGSPHHGFPLLAGPGRLVIKDAIMMGAAVITLADSAKAYLLPANPEIKERTPEIAIKQVATAQQND